MRLPGTATEEEISIEELIGELVSMRNGINGMNAEMRGLRAELVAKIGLPPGRRVILDDAVAEISFRLIIKVVRI